MIVCSLKSLTHRVLELESILVIVWENPLSLWRTKWDQRGTVVQQVSIFTQRIPQRADLEVKKNRGHVANYYKPIPQSRLRLSIWKKWELNDC